MLSRTAACLYWMSRQMERAENISRVLDVSLRSSMMPGGVGREQVMAPLDITGMRQAFLDTRARATADEILLFFALNPDNPSSIYSCLRMARENGHVVRGRITSEMWETLNSTWLDVQGMNRDKLKRMGVSRFLDWVKERSHLFRGATFGTLQRGDAFHFARLGTFLERADNTARILLVKAPTFFTEAGAADYYQWAALLRSLSAFETYRGIYRDSIEPAKVAEMLLLRDDLPRSLHACLNEITQTLEQIGGGRGIEAKRLAAELHARLHYARIDEVIDEGLQDYLEHFLTDINELGARIYSAYLET